MKFQERKMGYGIPIRGSGVAFVEERRKGRVLLEKIGIIIRVLC